jgi:F0F1-type ATP synthase membrane subunit c/vacuolar-type H+-ATPase subunit K
MDVQGGIVNRSVVQVGLAALIVGSAMSAVAAPVHAASTTQEDRASTFRMPNVVGMVLQDAQDLLQARGSYLMDQVDATGMGRWQILDSGWKVCWQKPRPGAKVSVSAFVTLGSVKLGERCP